jgi:NAD+ kinase
MRVGVVFRKGFSDQARVLGLVESKGFSLGGRPQLFISIGGDGTFLKAVGLAGDKPVLAINDGELGFLSQASLSNLGRALNKVKRKRYRVEMRLKLDVSVGGKKVAEALNDVFVTRRSQGSAIRLVVSVDALRLGSFVADGAVLSTPTGSTGYNASAGGAAVDASVDAFQLALVCPHHSCFMPIVLSPKRWVTVSFPRQKREPVLYVDGFEHSIPRNAKVGVKVSKARARVVVLEKGGLLERFAEHFA